MSKRRTELQILVQALTAVQYEIQALSPVTHADGHKLRAEAKVLMQSAQADANTLAFVDESSRERELAGIAEGRAGTPCGQDD